MGGALPWAVSPSHRVNVRSCIARQEEYLRIRTFQEVHLELLHRCGVDFDERYLW
jgi:putative transposase